MATVDGATAGATVDRRGRSTIGKEVGRRGGPAKVAVAVGRRGGPAVTVIDGNARSMRCTSSEEEGLLVLLEEEQLLVSSFGNCDEFSDGLNEQSSVWIAIDLNEQESLSGRSNRWACMAIGLNKQLVIAVVVTVVVRVLACSKSIGRVACFGWSGISTGYLNDPSGFPAVGVACFCATEWLLMIGLNR
jgi:hypothetical protein